MDERGEKRRANNPQWSLKVRQGREFPTLEHKVGKIPYFSHS